MRRLLSTALILSLAACASTPAPAVQTAPPAVTTTAPPTTTSVEASDAGAPTAATPEAADAGAVGAATPVDTAAPATTAATTTATPTATATATTTAPAGNPVAQGRAVFQRVCARCHEDGEDEGPTPNKRWAEARMRTLIRSGNRRMRAIPTTRLSDADLTLLVSYLRSTHAIQ